MNKNTIQFNEEQELQKFVAFGTETLKKQKQLTDAQALEEPPFLITQYNSEPLKNMIKYFAGQPGKLLLNKGVMLMGPTGTGKTQIMRLFSLWLVNKPARFRMVNCRDVQREAVKNGFEALYKYSKHSYNYNSGYHRDNGPVVYCFDDFGAENASKYYGVEINVMEELIQDRYNEMEETGMITHATTNIKDAQIFEDKYGPRVRDRLRQMFNLVEINGPSFRR